MVFVLMSSAFAQLKNPLRVQTKGAEDIKTKTMKGYLVYGIWEKVK
ncbi:MAG: hypothetical protein IJ167_01780 [Lachnospiraceae bacterium]|nr:hypothetical protein [Lachnospiraceae bacterium]